MEKYVLYVDTGNMPSAKAKEYIEEQKSIVQDFLGNNTKLLVLSSDRNTIEKLP